MNFIMDGGALFMVPLLILLAVIILLFTKGLKNNTEKTHKLINLVFRLFLHERNLKIS